MKRGLFDLPAPLLETFDRVLAMLLPDALRVLLYGLVLSYLGMLLYARFSNQLRLRAVRQLTRRRHRQLQDPDIDFKTLLVLSRQSIALSFRRLALVLGPSLIAMIPLLFLFPWLSNHFGAKPPAAGTELSWCVHPATDAVLVRISDRTPETNGCVVAPWPTDTFTLSRAGEITTLHAWTTASNVLHARRWWNALVANPAGELPASWGDSELHLEFPGRNLVGFGPGWLGHWLFLALFPGLIAGLYWRWRWGLV